MMIAMIAVTIAIPAAGAGEPDVDRVVHVARDAGALEQARHEDEQRHRDQDVVGGQAVHPLREDVERAAAEIAEQEVRPELHQEDDDRQKAGGEAQRHADRQQDDHADQQDHRNGTDVHLRSPVYRLFMGFLVDVFVRDVFDQVVHGLLLAPIGDQVGDRLHRDQHWKASA
jgi:hypothetical protein